MSPEVSPPDPAPLTPLQIDILWLEEQSWKMAGSKTSEFRDRHPDVTPARYTVELMRLLTDRRAYEHEGGRYAPVLNRINRLHADRLAARLAARTVTPQ